jgi:uncharacterized membrane protein
VAALDALLRWVHAVASFVWVGHLFFLNLVHAQVAPRYDADSRRRVVPELLPRALYWFRWGAAWTWVTGLLLAAMVYYSFGNLVRRDPVTDAAVLPHGAGVALSLGLLLACFFAYEAVARALARRPAAAGAALFGLLVATLYGLSLAFRGRAVFIQAGMMMGTIMAMNVWMRIWPAQRRMLRGLVGTGPAPEPAAAAEALQRARHNLYMAPGLVFAMVSNHAPTLYGWEQGWLALAAIVAAGFGATWLLLRKSASAAPARFGPEPARAPGGRSGAAG